MSAGYQAVLWTPFAKRFDIWMLLGIALFVAIFFGVSVAAAPPGASFTPLQVLIRATGTLAFLMLSFILIIGPLSRLTPRFKPFLYNRRHLGVTTFLVGLVHGVLVLVWYHSFGVLNPLVSILASNPRYDAIAGFPFESLGLLALAVLFVMAATSHDFWNANLGPGVWKALHMALYPAYAVLTAHIALGALQFEKHPLYFYGLVACCAGVAGLHLYSAFFASNADAAAEDQAGWSDVGAAADIPEGRAVVVQPPSGERIAVFRSGNTIAAVSNVCRHQGGPLGEGRVVDGCITCPWHGFQYRLEDGCSPAPYTEKIATYDTRLAAGGMVQVRLEPNAPGTARAVTSLPETTS